MYFIETIFSFLSRQVVTIHRCGLSPALKQLAFLIYLIVLFQVTAISICMHFGIDFYFEYDVFSRQYFYESPLRNKHIEYFLHFMPSFSMRLFYLLYLNGDSLVWKHLYDLVVRNKEQIEFQWKKSKSEAQNSWSVFSRFWPHMKVSKSSKLLYYPHLHRKLRVTCVVIYYTFEILTNIMGFLMLFFLLLDNYSQAMNDQFTVAQFAAVFTMEFSFLIYSVLNLTMTFLVTLTIYLVCHVYVDQYQKVNSKLAKVTVMLSYKNDDHHQQHYTSSLLKTSLATNAYRSVHTRLTVFILHYNNTTVSKIISAYLLCVLPVHAFATVIIYFQSDDMPQSFVLNIAFGLSIFWFNLIALNLVLARVNNKISCSGPTMGSIFARKGALADGKIQCTWFNSSESIWTREAFKLSTYYEMIWRSDHELAFTAGKTATMNWMFIVDVS